MRRSLWTVLLAAVVASLVAIAVDVFPFAATAQTLAIGINQLVLYGPSLTGGNSFTVAAGAVPAATRTVTVVDALGNTNLAQTSGLTTGLTTLFAQSLTPVATAAAIGTTQQTFTVTGLVTTDKVYVQGPVPTSLCPMTNARVSAANTLQVDFTTLTAAACTPAAGTYSVMDFR